MIADLDTNLAELNDQSQREWHEKLDRWPEFYRQWRRDEWQSYADLLTHCIVFGLQVGFTNGQRRCRVLEIGHGSGRGLAFLAEELKVPAELITGVEVLKYRHDECAERFPGVRLDVLKKPTARGLLNWLKRERKEGRWYDVVIARHVMEHLPHPELILPEIAGLIPVDRLFGMIVPMVGTEGEEVSHLTDIPIAWDALSAAQVGRDARRVNTMHPGVNTGRYRSITTAFKPGWLPLLESAKLAPVDFGYRKNPSQHKAKEAYAICRRVA
jgi:SAM-dependent methyltransferase